MTLNYSKLKSGQMISNRKYVLDIAGLARYLDAVGDKSGKYNINSGLVPPMAVASLGLRSIAEDVALTGGSLHTGQEFIIRRSARIGEKLTCKATILRNSTRSGWHFIVINSEIRGDGNSIVMENKTTLAIPSQEGADNKT